MLLELLEAFRGHWELIMTSPGGEVGHLARLPYEEWELLEAAAG